MASGRLRCRRCPRDFITTQSTWMARSRAIRAAAYFGGTWWPSAVEVPEAGADYYLPQDVPHGQVREIWHHSSVTLITYTTTCNTAEGRTRAAGYGSVRPISSSMT
jgi:hypothetical protein